MAQERCILPVKCSECGAVFDLWYDLQAQEQLRGASSEGQAFVSFEKRIGRLLRQQQSLCWNCRKKAMMEMPQSEESYDNQAGIEMEFEFE